MVRSQTFRRTSTSSPTLWRRMEVSTLDFLICTIEVVQPISPAKPLRRAWQTLSRQSAARQFVAFIGMALVFFCLGLLKGAL